MGGDESMVGDAAAPGTLLESRILMDDVKVSVAFSAVASVKSKGI